MRDQESVRTWEKQMPSTPEYTIPMNGGYQVLAHAQPAGLKNPITTSPPSVERGRLAYAYFCIQCHGTNLKGFGSVGQSFSPLPTDLTSNAVLQQTDGELYYKIRWVQKHLRSYDSFHSDTWSIVNTCEPKKTEAAGRDSERREPMI